MTEQAQPARLERILPFLALTVFLDLIGFGIILPLLPSYVGEMGGSPQMVGVLFASFAAAQLVATPVLGRVSDRFGRRRVIFISLAANAVAMTLFAVAATHHALWLLFASRILAGTTSGTSARVRQRSRTSPADRIACVRSASSVRASVSA